jgi:6-phosphofructo-2-kinase
MERRMAIWERCKQEENMSVMFLESICTDPSVLSRNMKLKLRGPDYQHMNPDKALEDFKERVSNYEKAYETINDEEEEAGMQYCKLINVGKKVISYNIDGYLPAQVVFYLMNVNLARRQIYLSRCGESFDDVHGRIGGNSPLTERGRTYAHAMSAFVQRNYEEFKVRVERERQAELEEFGCYPEAQEINKKFTVLTSTLKRAKETAVFPTDTIKPTHLLNEICSGECDGLTPAEMKLKYPVEYAARQKDKLRVRYPGASGESYLDVIERLQPMLIDFERIHDSMLVISDTAVIRTLLAYVKDLHSCEMLNMQVPLHTLFCVEPVPYGFEFKQWTYNFAAECFEQADT